MKFNKLIATIGLAAILASGAALAGYDHAGMNPEFTPATSVASLPAGCRLLADDITNLRPIFIDCDDVVGLESAVTASDAEVNYNDITTLGTAQASKTLTFDASLDAILPTGALTTYQSGAGLTLNSGSTFTVDSVAVNHAALSLPGRAEITICGDGTTINNNTVYYGPSMVPVAGAGRTCDITQAGNTTEATADEAALDATAFQVLSMDCLTADPGASGVSFTLRSAAAATTPSVTCSVANTKKGCTANVQTTTAIASGATVAIAAASAGNQGTTPFVCTLHVAY